MPTLFTEIVNQLFLRMEELAPIALYPDRVPKINERIIGTAFFPFGSGLYLEPNSEASDPGTTRT